jgi:hypothetical protein
MIREHVDAAFVPGCRPAALAGTAG